MSRNGNTIKVIHLATSISPSSACSRLNIAERNNDIDSKMIVGFCNSEMKYVEKYTYQTDIFSRIYRKINRIRKMILEKYVFGKYKIISNMPYTKDLYGMDILKNKQVYKEIKDSDIIHLHWICGFVSLKDIAYLSKAGKVIVWTFHDIWPLTGGCHCDYDCERYKASLCGKCPLLITDEEKDLSTIIMMKKYQILNKVNMTIIAPSNWMKNNTLENMIFKGKRVFVIPNTIDTNIFFPKESDYIFNKIGYSKNSNKIHILFSSYSINIEYKGYKYFLEMLSILRRNHFELSNRIVIHLLGKKPHELEIIGEFENKLWDLIGNQENLAAVYSMADYLVYPSLCDNLPNTVMEALSCETPVVAFDIGGISDLIEHKVNGYLAKPRSSEDLLNGLLWLIANNDSNILGKNGRNKVMKSFSEEVVAKQHYKLYEELLENA